MIDETRTDRLKRGASTCHPGLMGATVTRKQHFGQLVGSSYSEIGPFNEIVHVWAGADLGDRDRHRTALAVDPRWQGLLPKIQALIEATDDKILKTASSSTLT